MIGGLARRLFGTANDRIVGELQGVVEHINSLEDSVISLSDEQLAARTPEFRERLAQGETLGSILPEAFATVREAAKRTLGERHYDVQLIGGMVLHQGKIAEMRTGEGKTLVSTLPVYLNALAGKGVHLVTVNDYLAARDAEWMGKIYDFLGLSVGVIVHGLSDVERRQQYSADVTYGTNNEFGFDYLRDNMKFELSSMVQRTFNFAIVDEVDSILVDEARTPLIISGPTPKGDEHEFAELKGKVEQLLSIQRKAVTGFLTEAKKNLGDESLDKAAVKDGGLALYRAFRGLPKSKALIKFLSLDGMRQQLLKTEGFHLQDNQRNMPEADAELYFVINEKQNQIELTEKGLALITVHMDDD